MQYHSLIIMIIIGYISVDLDLDVFFSFFFCLCVCSDKFEIRYRHNFKNVLVLFLILKSHITIFFLFYRIGVENLEFFFSLEQAFFPQCVNVSVWLNPKFDTRQDYMVIIYISRHWRWWWWLNNENKWTTLL